MVIHHPLLHSPNEPSVVDAMMSASAALPPSSIAARVSDGSPAA
jgi:hypothetical protein